ncbi:BnaA09g35040D [Brassica napus]|uniref:Uncharacterized protein n=2 Tax=Brassica TaxID=3705 RepID=A0A3P5YPJ1_BRACM|nr:unnamed protein product [Brassica napus]CDY40222.1 BnaA09g35040D [Brassica napus]VDC62681.1 unnamed protein product [Brassica rapa]
MSHPPPLSSLPDDIVLRCLALVPRMYHLNISWVSKDLRSLVRSPELNLLRSTLRSLHLCFQEDHSDNNSSFHWFTLNEAEHGLVLNPTPFPSHPSYGSSSTVAVGSNIFFMGGSREPSTDLWILDTRSGNITKGPSMSVARVGRTTAVGVIDGKIYVMGGGEFNEEMQVEVFDPETETETTWELAGVEKVRKISRCSATPALTVEGKVYMVEYVETNVYNPRGGEGERMVRMERFTDMAHSVCVVEDVLFAFFTRAGLMWFDTKINVWRRLVGPDGKDLVLSRVKGMSEYHDGRLVVFNYIFATDDNGLWDVNEVNKNVQCMLVSLDRAGDKICGRIDWSGIVATVPVWFNFLHCLPVSQ